MPCGLEAEVRFVYIVMGLFLMGGVSAAAYRAAQPGKQSSGTKRVSELESEEPLPKDISLDS